MNLASGFLTRCKRVVGGCGAKTGEFPFLALIGYKRPNKTANDGIEYGCGGALINKYVIIYIFMPKYRSSIVIYLPDATF